MRVSSQAGLIILLVATLFIAYSAGQARTSGKPLGWYGSVVCGDTATYDCLTIEPYDKEEWIETPRGPKIVTHKVVRDWEERWPDEDERRMIKKINRLNSGLREGYQIAVPKDLTDKTSLDFAPFPDTIRSRRKTIIVDLSILAFAAYDKKELVRWGPAAGGKSYCPDVRRGCRTPLGNYSVISEYGAEFRSRRYPIGCRGKSCAHMPYSIFFKPAYAIHGGVVPGRHQSHGCIRVFYEDAKWLNLEFARNGTRIIVRSYKKSL